MASQEKKPPRWFILAIVLGGALAVAGLAGMGYLLYDPPHDPVEIGDRSYLIPHSELVSLQHGPPAFLRVSPPEEPFDIVHDGRVAAQRDGIGLPLIFSVNDHRQHDVWYGRHGRSVVVCRRTANPLGGCGTWLNYGGATWAVLFPESRVEDADVFARSASGHLRRYDTKVRRLLN